MTGNGVRAAVVQPKQRQLRGILLASAAFCVLPLNDAIAKYLVTDYDVAQLVWVRMFFQALVVGAWFALARHKVRWSLARSWILVGSMVMAWLANFPIMFALIYMSLASAFALIMTAPLLVTALSAPLLGERVGLHRWVAVLVGFAGAVVIIRPGADVFSWAAVLPLLSAILFALYQIGVRRLASNVSTSDLIFYASWIPLIGSCFLVPFFWSWPTVPHWGLMALMGIGAGLGHYMLILALNYAPASLLAPFMYVQMVSSTVIGLLMFGDFPDAITLLGAGVVVGAGLYGMARGRSTDARSA